MSASGSYAAPSASGGSEGASHSAFGGHGGASLPPTRITSSPVQNPVGYSRGPSGGGDISRQPLEPADPAATTITPVHDRRRPERCPPPPHVDLDAAAGRIVSGGLDPGYDHGEVRHLRRRSGNGPAPNRALDALRLEAQRGRALVEESREIVVILDDNDRVVAASRRARELLGGLEEGAAAPDQLVQNAPLVIPYEVDGRRETILYARDTGDMAAYEELRAGFTAAVSHELRTPFARVLALLETATLPGSDVIELVEQAQGEIDTIRELIDDILFLSELESGHEVVGLGTTLALPILAEVVESLEEQAARAGVTVELEADEDVELPLRPRMIRVVAQNLAQNSVRYAGPGARLRLSARHTEAGVELIAADSGIGVAEEDLPRLFERFYRADPARSSRGTGLGLAIVKHVVNSAGGTVEATGARGRGLTIRCHFPTASS